MNLDCEEEVSSLFGWVKKRTSREELFPGGLVGFYRLFLVVAKAGGKGAEYSRRFFSPL
jgi:hypothetical protein